MRFSFSRHLGGSAFVVGVVGLLAAWMVAGCGGGVLPDTGDASGGRDLGSTCGTGACDAGAHGDAGSAVDAALGDDAGPMIDGGTADDAGSAVDTGTPLDAGATMDAGGGDDAGTSFDSGVHRDASLMCTGTPTPGCCLMDSDCTGGDVCYGASCGIFGGANSGRCLAPPTTPGACWDNTDCPMSTGIGGGCTGALMCRCGAPCPSGFEHQGTCSMGFPFP